MYGRYILSSDIMLSFVVQSDGSITVPFTIAAVTNADAVSIHANLNAALTNGATLVYFTN